MPREAGKWRIYAETLVYVPKPVERPQPPRTPSASFLRELDLCRLAILVMVAIVGLLFLGLCAGCAMPEKSYVQADRAKFRTIAGAHRRYVLADSSLDEDARQTRLDSLDSWEDRITAAERSLGIALPTTPTGTAR